MSNLDNIYVLIYNIFNMSRRQKIYLPFKRLIGFIGSLIGIVFCFVFLWWWIIPVNLIVTKGHPFFVQKRLGKKKKVFGLIKFRSMSITADPNLAPANMNVESQKSMETKFGKFLRASSLDETLQLFNILIGQMAFIGPRPGAAINEDELVIEREKFTPNAYDVKPGLSGLAQVRMKRNHSPQEKAKLDHEYVKKLNFFLDFKLFFQTIFGVCGGKDGAR